jgi:hypothetical protein
MMPDTAAVALLFARQAKPEREGLAERQWRQARGRPEGKDGLGERGYIVDAITRPSKRLGGR